MSFTPLTSLNNVDASTFNAVFTELDAGSTALPISSVVGFRVDVLNTLTITVSPGITRDDTNTVNIKRTTAAGNISLASLSTGNGINKLDTGSLANNTWYYVYVVSKADGTVGGLLSLSSSLPTMPSGYVYKRRIGMVRTNSSAVLHRQYTLDDGLVRQVLYLENTTTGDWLVANGVDVSHSAWDTITLTSVVPPTSRMAKVSMAVSIGTTNIHLYWRIHSTMQSRLLYQGAASERYPILMDLPITTGQTFEVKASGSATEVLTINVLGYVDNLVSAIV